MYITADKRLGRLNSRKVCKSDPPISNELKALQVEKLSRIIQTNYLEPGFVKWDIRCFGVPKGDTDIRLVYDGTSSGVNDIVWAPSFFLPTSVSLSRQLQIGTYQMDVDIGEMFLNFPLHASMRPFCGVNLSKFLEIYLQFNESCYRWNRTWIRIESF